MRQTLLFSRRPVVRAAASIAGPKEGKGPLGDCFDRVLADDLLGMESWELAESEMLRQAIELALQKGGLTAKALEMLLSGDLLNQITSSGFAGRAIGAPFVGLYGACSTFAEALVLGGTLLEGGFRENAVCSASSHFCAAERQFRFPLELGNQRPPSAQWTATAAGALLLDMGAAKGLARLTHGTLGRVIDYDVKDANHMGAAMAPAVADTYLAHMLDTKRTHADYDRIVTGDLGIIGRKLFLELLAQRGAPLPEEKQLDCGAALFYPEQDAHAGGSGCGCIASVFCGHVLPKIASGEWRRVLALGSGAMLSTTSTQQGQSIPCISYAAAFEGE